MKKFSLIVAVLQFGFLALCNAQTPLPVDSEVRVGHLENGLTYYIRHNELPKERAEFHIAQAVGATLEEDDQNGLAHFLEHMCFNGTEHFPGKGIINYFESVGVNFGGNINAYTSLDQTVYRLSEVPTYREGIVDSALLVMHDWSCAVSLLGEEIDAERGVIREEWRTGNTAQRRAWRHSMQIMFPGTRYETRDVIGDTAVINNFSHDALRAYYKKWYGPDLQAIIVVGDIDVDAIEAKIKALWADVPARENRGVRPYQTIEPNVEPIVGIYTDKELQSTSIEFIIKHQPLPDPLKGTDVALVQDICNRLMRIMLNERMNEIIMRADAPIAGASMGYYDFLPTMDAFDAEVVAKEGKEREAMALMLTQVEKMRRYGFTTDEYERAKTNLLNNYEKMYNERTATRNIQYVNNYIDHFLHQEAIPGIATEYELVKQILPMIPVDALNQMVKEMVSEENRIVVITAPEKETVVLPTVEEVKAALATMSELEIEAPVAQVVDGNLVKKAPKMGKIKSIAHNESLGTTEWTLKNGIRVVIKPTQFKQDEILMQAYSWGGMSLVATEDLPSAELATTAVDFMGIGNYSMTDLQKALSGKTVSVQAAINANSESIEGESSVKDLETMLQLVYLGFTAPRRSEEDFATLIGLLENSLRNKDNNPKAIFRDSVSLMQNGYSPRTVLMDMETLSRISLDRCMAVFNARFANPADFTFMFVGNVNPDDPEFMRLVCTYLGGLKTTKAREQYRDLGIRVPEGIAKNYFSREMTTHTASNRIQYTSYDIPYTLDNELNMEMVGRILGTRYLESIREREGGSYGVGTYGYIQATPISKAAVIMQFDTDPEKQTRLMEIIHEEVQTIVNLGPLATDLQKEKESMLKDYKENVEKNEWWMDALDSYEKLGVNLYTDYEAAVKAITAETVQATLKKLVEAGNVFEVVMFPAE